MDDVAVLGVLQQTADAVREALGALDNWDLAGVAHPAQYRSDVAADEAALRVLESASLGVLSEESGLHHAERRVVVVLDPIDGSSNASRSLPWYATSACAVDENGPWVALVVNQATGERFEAVRGKGARCDGHEIRVSGCTRLDAAVIGCSGWPETHPGWREFRVLDAAALDLSAVAAGRLDGWVDCEAEAHGPWDYMAAMLICEEAGGQVCDAFGRDLHILDPSQRRTPVAAANAELLEALVTYRRSFVGR